MHDPEQQLIAQNEHSGGAHTTGDAPAKQEGHTQEGHGGEKHGEEGGGNQFNALFNQLNDHHEISFGHVHLIDLPVIIIDNGLHLYPSVEKMNEEGKFTYDHHHNHIYRAGTEQTPTLDLSITSLVAFQWLAMILLAVILIPMARRYRSNGNRPMRGFFNAMEAVVVYVRDQIVEPNLGHDGKKLLPIFLTLFFFILTMNLIGLVPGGHSATGSVNVTAGLAIVAFFVIQLAAIFKNGLGTWLKHLTGGVPMWLWPIMVPVEVLGLFTKPFALCMRLFANMTAGHVILLSLIGLVYVGKGFIPVTVGFSLFINLLELLVAFLQAYIFTVLTAVFTSIGLASHSHDHDTEGLSEHAAAH